MKKITWESVEEFKPELSAEATDREKIRANMLVELKKWKEKIDADKEPNEKKALTIYNDILDKQIDVLHTRKHISAILMGEKGEDHLELSMIGTKIDWNKTNLWNVIFFDKIAQHLMRSVYTEVNGPKAPRPKKVKKFKQKKVADKPAEAEKSVEA